MFNKKGICPFIESCEYYQKILKLERELSFNRRKATLGLKDVNEYDEEDDIDIQRKYDTFKRLRSRCFENHGHCLRFWRLSKKDSGVMPNPLQHVSPVQSNQLE